MKKSTERKMNIVVIVVLGINVVAVIGIFVIRSIMYTGDLLENGSLRLETVPAPGTVLTDIETCVHSNKLIVKGLVRRKGGSEIAGRGEVTITLLSPAGEALASRGAWYSLPPGERSDLAHFEAHLDIVPPDGSTMQIKFTESTAQTPTTSGIKDRAD